MPRENQAQKSGRIDSVFDLIEFEYYLIGCHTIPELDVLYTSP